MSGCFQLRLEAKLKIELKKQHNEQCKKSFTLNWGFILNYKRNEFFVKKAKQMDCEREENISVHAVRKIMK